MPKNMTAADAAGRAWYVAMACDHLFGDNLPSGAEVHIERLATLLESAAAAARGAALEERFGMLPAAPAPENEPMPQEELTATYNDYIAERYAAPSPSPEQAPPKLPAIIQRLTRAMDELGTATRDLTAMCLEKAPSPEPARCTCHTVIRHDDGRTAYISGDIDKLKCPLHGHASAKPAACARCGTSKHHGMIEAWDGNADGDGPIYRRCPACNGTGTAGAR
jgi:hypothetical protein